MNRWSRNELLQALNLYHRTPFGKQHSTYPPIVELARKLGRTPGSVSMKLNNLTSLDPIEQERGIKGLSGASKLDRAIWEEFENDLPPSLKNQNLCWRLNLSNRPGPPKASV